MDAHVGKDRNNKFCLHNLLNRNSEYLAKFSLENRLACLNTKFQKRDGTYEHTLTHKAQLDILKEVDK